VASAGIVAAWRQSRRCQSQTSNKVASPLALVNLVDEIIVGLGYVGGEQQNTGLSF